MNTLMRWNPFQEMMNWRSEVDRLFEESFGLPQTRWQGATNWGLALDVRENQDAFIVTAAVPGVNPDDLDITLTDNVLTIKGEVKADEVSENEQYHLHERRYGSFSRSLSLPVPVVAEEIEASYENGILTLTIPKAEEVKPKRIAVKAHGNGSRAIEGQFSQS